MQAISILYFIILIVSIVIHEVAHGYAADRLGDPTPRLQGRLTLNPISHIDIFGSIILPLLLVLTNASFFLGWAKPVPFNPYYFKNKRWGPVIVALAGPISNVLLAIIAALVLAFFDLRPIGTSLLVSLVHTNIALAVFNLLPIPPLDGHHVLFALLPSRFDHIKTFFRKYSFVFLVIFVLYGWPFISPIINTLVGLLV